MNIFYAFQTCIISAVISNDCTKPSFLIIICIGINREKNIVYMFSTFPHYVFQKVSEYFWNIAENFALSFFFTKFFLLQPVWYFNNWQILRIGRIVKRNGFTSFKIMIMCINFLEFSFVMLNRWKWWRC